jgi:hypothetical protein
MSLVKVRSELRWSISGIAALISFFPTLLYFIVVPVPGLEDIARKPEIFYYGLCLFGRMQIIFWGFLGIFLLLLWRE